MNRDDATGFRLDTLTTCKQHANPVTQGHDILTTRTDYVNKYPSIIQTTSYNFTRTNTTGEVCVGVVKAPPIHSKNPAQHYSFRYTNFVPNGGPTSSIPQPGDYFS